ncbi:DUF3180 domain-containing protein [Hoyosella rhizosphaerae]|uniref:DUF3180 domain-containing protein n=1 Tax=Hoyosella rhizosphaerae TaxID=1755582 RepID=UPI0027DDAFA2|nr:DUF3180 domain-containing protein [Hoyosella rhizosphaerae]
MTRFRDLVVLGISAAIAGWLMTRSFYTSLPPLRWYVGASLYFVAAAELAGAVLIRNRVRSRRIGIGPTLLHPLAVAQAVALAKASALLGAALAGLWVGVLVVIVPDFNVTRAATEDLPGAIIGAIGAAVLVVAALLLERACRTPTDDEEDRTQADNS